MQHHRGSSARRGEHVAGEMRRVFFYHDFLIIYSEATFGLLPWVSAAVVPP
jgi:hypothetical protein